MLRHVLSGFWLRIWSHLVGTLSTLPQRGHISPAWMCEMVKNPMMSWRVRCIIVACRLVLCWILLLKDIDFVSPGFPQNFSTIHHSCCCVKIMLFSANCDQKIWWWRDSNREHGNMKLFAEEVLCKHRGKNCAQLFWIWKSTVGCMAKNLLNWQAKWILRVYPFESVLFKAYRNANPSAGPTTLPSTSPSIAPRLYILSDILMPKLTLRMISVPTIPCVEQDWKQNQFSLPYYGH